MSKSCDIFQDVGNTHCAENKWPEWLDVTPACWYNTSFLLHGIDFIILTVH